MIRVVENIESKSIEELITEINDSFAKISKIKNKYDTIVNSICDSTNNWLFNVKLRKAACADNAEEDFEVYAMDTWNSWQEDVRDITGMEYEDVMASDNHHGSYFDFKSSFSILCGEDIDFSTFKEFIETMSYEGEIVDYNEEDIDEFVVDNKIDADKFKEVFAEYDDNGREYVVSMSNELQLVLGELKVDIDKIEQIVDLYNRIKENQVKDIESYKLM